MCVCVYYVRQYIKRPWTKRVVRLYHSFSLFENYPLPPSRSLGLFHRKILVAVPWVGSLSFRHALLYFLIILALPIAFSTRTLFFYHNLCWLCYSDGAATCTLYYIVNDVRALFDIVLSTGQSRLRILQGHIISIRI